MILEEPHGNLPDFTTKVSHGGGYGYVSAPLLDDAQGLTKEMKILGVRHSPVVFHKTLSVVFSFRQCSRAQS